MKKLLQFCAAFAFASLFTYTIMNYMIENYTNWEKQEKTIEKERPTNKKNQQYT